MPENAKCQTNSLFLTSIIRHFAPNDISVACFRINREYIKSAKEKK
jgi:hypothetical protein